MRVGSALRGMEIGIHISLVINVFLWAGYWLDKHHIPTLSTLLGSPLVAIGGALGSPGMVPALIYSGHEPGYFVVMAVGNAVFYSFLAYAIIHPGPLGARKAN